jgi:hypothetical protein
VSIQHVAPLAGTLILLLLVCFQALLALGVPLGRAAWGGSHTVLPTKLRWASLAAVPVLGIAAWAILAGGNVLAPGPDVTIVRVLVWFFAAYFLLNTVMNQRSKSLLERSVMTPVALALVLCFVTVAIS